MIWFILYVLIAAAVMFGLCLTHIKLGIEGEFGDSLLWIPVLCGIFWPVAAPAYAAILAAIYYSKRR